MSKNSRTRERPGVLSGPREGVMRRRARAAVTAVIAAGVEAYDRSRHLPRLIPIDAAGLADGSMEARRAIVARLARALRAERNRGRAGHWTYDLNRHIGLRQAWAAERRALTAMSGSVR